jgi:NAD+ synthase
VYFMEDYSEGKIIEFIKAGVENAGADGAVLGLSGGIDSAVTACLATAALGPEKVMVLLLPERGVTAPQDIEDARALSRVLHIRSREIDIAPILECYTEQLGAKDVSRIAMGNLKARVRMTMLYWHANLLNLIVLGTGNKTEIMLGYSTKHGDAAADLLPLAGLYKRDVRALAERLSVPESIRTKEPTAGLWPGQTDEGEMGITYSEADAMLESLEHGQSSEALSKVYGSAKVDLILERIQKGVHKREPPARPD